MKNILPYHGKYPHLEEDVFIAPGAFVLGNVSLAKGSNVWFNAVIRGDDNHIDIGEYVNIQDNCTIHCDLKHPTIVGNRVSIGHNAVLHGCKLEDSCLIGMGAVVLNNAVIGRGSIVGAGAVVTEGSNIPPFSLVLGMPGRIVKTLDESIIEERKVQSMDYYTKSREYRGLGGKA